jgi:hypothetical protein
LTKSRKNILPEELVDLAHRKLSLSRSAWVIECIIFSNPLMLRTTHVRTRRHADRSVAYRTRAEREPVFLAAVSDSVTELRRWLDDETRSRPS